MGESKSANMVRKWAAQRLGADICQHSGLEASEPILRNAQDRSNQTTSMNVAGGSQSTSGHFVSGRGYDEACFVRNVEFLGGVGDHADHGGDLSGKLQPLLADKNHHVQPDPVGR